MKPAIFDIEWMTGDTSYLELFYNDSDGLPMDLTGYEFAMEIKEKRTDIKPVLFTKMADIIDLETSHILFTYEPYETMDLAGTKIKGLYYYDVEARSPGGEVTTILYGRISIDRSITNQD